MNTSVYARAHVFLYVFTSTHAYVRTRKKQRLKTVDERVSTARARKSGQEQASERASETERSKALESAQERASELAREEEEKARARERVCVRESARAHALT